MRLEHRQRIAAPISRVWEVTVDIDALPQVTPTISAIERLDDQPLGVGSEVRIKQPVQRAKVWTITEFVVDHRFTWVTESAGLAMTATHELAETADGTENTLSIDIDGRFARILGPLMAVPIRRALATENRGIRTAAEA